jgi:hypothetical protein
LSRNIVEGRAKNGEFDHLSLKAISGAIGLVVKKAPNSPVAVFFQDLRG